MSREGPETSNPIEGLLEAARRHLEAGALAAAERVCIDALQLEPSQPDALRILGTVAQHRGQHEPALELFAAALEARPRDARLHHDLAISLRALDRLEDARRFFVAALALQPNAPLTLTCLGNTLRALGRPEDAIERHLSALELQPDVAGAWSNLALAYRDLERFDEAIEAFRAGIALEPVADLYHNLGNTQLLAGRPVEAEASFRRGLELDPRHPGCRVDLGTALQWQGRIDEAIAAFRATIDVDPGQGHAHSKLAADHADGHSKLAADHADAHWNLAPDHADAHWNLALALLQRGDALEGWHEYEWRRRLPVLSLPPIDVPEWDGSPLVGRTLLLRAEQGLGDTLQFARFARLAGGTVLLECQPALARLLRGSDGVSSTLPRGASLPSVDVQAPLMSLPHLLRTGPEAATPPYLHAEPALVAHWRSHFDPEEGLLRSQTYRPLRIGICWQGNPRYRADRQRSFPLRHFAALARLPGARLYSLQKGVARDQLTALPSDTVIEDLGADLDNDTGAFVDTAAVMTSLDLVISSDTAIPHLAGALGLEVWLLLARPADWRWGMDESSTPWYPRMRLFRQTTPGIWDEVFDRVGAALKERLNRPPYTTPDPGATP